MATICVRFAVNDINSILAASSRCYRRNGSNSVSSQWSVAYCMSFACDIEDTEINYHHERNFRTRFLFNSSLLDIYRARLRDNNDQVIRRFVKGSLTSCSYRTGYKFLRRKRACPSQIRPRILPLATRLVHKTLQLMFPHGASIHRLQCCSTARVWFTALRISARTDRRGAAYM